MTTTPPLSDAVRDDALRAFDGDDGTFAPRRYVVGPRGKVAALKLAIPFLWVALIYVLDSEPIRAYNLTFAMIVVTPLWGALALMEFLRFFISLVADQATRKVQRVDLGALLAELEPSHEPAPISIAFGGVVPLFPHEDDAPTVQQSRFVASLTPTLHDALHSLAPHVSRRTCSHLIAHLLGLVFITPRTIVPRHSTTDPWSQLPSIHALHAYAGHGVEAALDVLLSYATYPETGSWSRRGAGVPFASAAIRALAHVDREIYRALDPDRRDRLMDALSDADSSAREALFGRVGSETVREDLQRWLRSGGATSSILHALAWLQRVHPTCFNEAAWRGEAIALLENTVSSEDAPQDSWCLAVRLTGALEGPDRIEELLPSILPRFSNAARSDRSLSFDDLRRATTEISDALGAQHATRLMNSRDSPFLTLVGVALSHPNARYATWTSAFNEIRAVASREVLVEIATQVMRALPVDHDVRRGGAYDLTTLVLHHPDTRIRADLLAMELVAPEVRRRIDAIDKLATYSEGIEALERELPRVSDLATIGYVAQALLPIDPDATSRILIHCARHAADSDDRVEAVSLMGEVGALAAIPALQSLAQSERRLREAAERAVAQIQAREASGASHGGLAIAAQEDGALSIDHDAGSGLALEVSSRDQRLQA